MALRAAEGGVRKSFGRARRVLVKVGSNVLTNDEGRLAIGRIGELVEQIARLVSKDRKEVILVSSGAVAVGSRRLSFQRRLSQSILQSERSIAPSPRAAASAGQTAFMAMYEQMFSQFDLTVGNVLITHADLASQGHIQTFAHTIDELLASSIIPVINENDVTNQILTDRPMWFKDNDSLSAKLASDLNAQLLLLLTDVPGVYAGGAPGEKGSHLIDYYSPAIDQIKFGEKSSKGRGGMESKMEAAIFASRMGVEVVIASGTEPRVIDRIFRGDVLGTVFTAKWAEQGLTPRQVCNRARDATPVVQRLSADDRSGMLRRFAAAVRSRRRAILDANAADLAAMRQRDEHVSPRHTFSDERLESLSRALDRLSDTPDPIHRTLEKRELTGGLTLVQETTPLGVVMCVTEDAVDVLAQVVGLALRTGNVLIFYDHGGALQLTNEAVLKVAREAIGPGLPEEALQYCTSETDLGRLLNQDEPYIDIILPRAAPNALKARLDRLTNVPVLGHSSATCHVYVDGSADMAKAVDIVLDSKAQNVGPGCNEADNYLSDNAMDTLLVHESMVSDGRVLQLIKSLTDRQITLYGGPRAASTLGLKEAPTLSAEWNGDAIATVEIVASVDAAAEFIKTHGSGMVDVIVAEDPDAAALFLAEVDSACVFHNASTRFADGYRLGLGAETGVSTRRVHARGPVGVKGLLSTKWTVRSAGCHTITQHVDGHWAFTHVDHPIGQKDAPPMLPAQQQAGAAAASPAAA